MTSQEPLCRVHDPVFAGGVPFEVPDAEVLAYALRKRHVGHHTARRLARMGASWDAEQGCWVVTTPAGAGALMRRVRLHPINPAASVCIVCALAAPSLLDRLLCRLNRSRTTGGYCRACGETAPARPPS